MKLFKKILCLLLIQLCSSSLINAHSHSIFIPRSVTTDSLFELSLVNYRRYHLENCSNIQSYVRPFFMASTNKKDLARYFLPKNKKCISLDQAGNGDVDPLWLNLIAPLGTNYTSTVCIRPERKVAGILFTFYVDLCKQLWFGLNTAFMHVSHNLELKELHRTQNGILPGFANACDAFNNPAWKYGKLSCHARTLNGLDDIQLKLGYDFYLEEDCNHATAYLVATAPTGKGDRAHYLFEPLIGSKQPSFGAGFNGDYTLYSDGVQQRVNILADVKYLYIFSTTERRSFDLLNNGDWSRYLLVVEQCAPLFSLPGINLFTLPAKVTQGSTIDIWCALHYERCAWNFEIGYDFWWRQKEKIARKGLIPENTFGIQTLALCSTPVTSASTANISQSAVGPNATVSDPVFTFLTNADINLQSGAQPSSLSQTIYADIGYTIEGERFSGLFGIGGSYEFAARNAFDQWAIWLTIGGEF